MASCEPQLLSAYLDNELSPDVRRRVEQHLADCEACATELSQLRESSQMLQGYSFEDLKPIELARLHQAIKRDDSEQPIFRMGMMLSGLAASILIICSAWLMEIPERPAKPSVNSVANFDPAPWERTAVTLKLDPLPADFDRDRSIQFADAQFAAWMLEGLKN